MANEALRLLPLGGLGEIGMNSLVIQWRDEIILIDCGIQFPDAGYSGVELLAPDFSYLLENKRKLKAVVITHGHDDHIGALPFLAQGTSLDIFCTKFPAGLIRQKFEEVPPKFETKIHEIEPHKSFQVGSFKLHPIEVQHSIIEALGFAIETPVGTLIHTGDFKHDTRQRDGVQIGFEPFEEWGRKGVLLLLSDSTNAERPGHTLSEENIIRSLERILTTQTGRVIVALFASNIRRVESLLYVASQQGKKVAFAGRSMHSYVRLAHEQGSIKLPENTLVLLENASTVPDEKLVILATGSQAEPQSALVRISEGVHKDITIKQGDLVLLSSRFIPGNERAIQGMIDHLYRSGAEVLYESFHEIHVSGHGFQEELLMMLRATKPKFFIPVHGEYRHLSKHAQLAKREAGVQEICLVENGRWVELTKTSIKAAEWRRMEKQPIVSGHFMNSEPQLFATRMKLSRAGVVFVTLFRDGRSRRLLRIPKVVEMGTLLRKGEAAEVAMADVESLIQDVYAEHAKDPELEEVIRVEVRRFFRRIGSYKPAVIVVVLDI